MVNIKTNQSGEKRPWQNLSANLEKHGIIGATIIPPEASDGCLGFTRERILFRAMPWVQDELLLLAMSGEETALVEAFTELMGFQPSFKIVALIDARGHPFSSIFVWSKSHAEELFTSAQKFWGKVEKI